MRNRKNKRFRYRSNGRGPHIRHNGGDQTRISPNSFSNDRPRNNFKSHQSADKLAEKYYTLAKEALSSGDKILSENYFQHADHFMRIVQIKNLNQAQHKIETNNENKIEQNNLKENIQNTSAEEEKK